VYSPSGTTGFESEIDEDIVKVVLNAKGGDDLIDGGLGDDVLNGGKDGRKDSLHGGAGADSFEDEMVFLGQFLVDLDKAKDFQFGVDKVG
jgi:Ca2+-binding RTX toxin-like protein